MVRRILHFILRDLHAVISRGHEQSEEVSTAVTEARRERLALQLAIRSRR